jgi:general secretion pathway protein A
LQIIFLGQKELEAKLRSPELRQLNQRISIRYFLGPLSKPETYEYIAHRLNMAGGAGFVQFEQRAVENIYKYSQGVPRTVNILCDRVLLEAFAQKVRVITPRIVSHARADIEGALNPSASNMIVNRKRPWEFWKWF